MSRTRSLRAPFVITVASVASTLAACGGSTTNDHAGSGGSAASAGSGGAGNVSGGGGHGNVSGGGSGNFGGSGGSGNVSGGGGMGAEGGFGGTGVPPSCPASFPPSGTACNLPSGTACDYDQGPCCPPSQAICQDGIWQAFISTCNPPAPVCPGTPPTDGSACSDPGPCGASFSCSYGQCADGSTLMYADCINGVWKLSIANCQPMPCEQLSACDCFARPDCQAESDSCICECDFNCPGVPPCVCACGGGQFLGCATKSGFP